jgi:hypothetical protein
MDEPLEMIHNVDVGFYHFLRFTGNWLVDRLVAHQESNMLFKSGLFLTAYWYLWFRPGSDQEKAAKGDRTVTRLPQEVPRVKARVITVLAVLCIVVALIITIAETVGAPPQSAAQAAVPAERQTAKQNAHAGMLALRWGMRNPETFSLETATLMPDGSVCYSYRAQNGFGGMNRQHAVLTPKYEIKLDASAWKKYCSNRLGVNLTASELVTP